MGKCGECRRDWCICHRADEQVDDVISRLDDLDTKIERVLSAVGEKNKTADELADELAKAWKEIRRLREGIRTIAERAGRPMLDDFDARGFAERLLGEEA